MTPSPNPRAVLSALTRVATLAALTVGLLVAFTALQELSLTAAAGTLDTPDMELGALKGLVVDQETTVAARRAFFRAQLTALEAMQWQRVLVLGLLTLSASGVFVSALWLRWPGASRRSSTATWLSRGAVASAVLRTIDGAQLLNVTRNAVAASERILSQSSSPELRAPAGMNLFVASTISIGTTTLMVAAFVAAAVYFQSEGLQRELAELDRFTPDDGDDEE